MAKQLFKNYNFDFDKNETKLIITFCKQAVKQMGDDKRFLPDIRAFESILNKLSAATAEVKFTKDERNRLLNQIEENIKHIKKQIDKSWFIKKWLYKSMYSQYVNLLNKHFDR